MNASKAGKGDERNRNVFNSRQPVIHIAFVKGFVYHDFSYLPSSDHCVKVGSNFLQEIIKPSNVIGCTLQAYLPYITLSVAITVIAL